MTVPFFGTSWLRRPALVGQAAYRMRAESDAKRSARICPPGLHQEASG